MSADKFTRTKTKIVRAEAGQPELTQEQHSERDRELLAHLMPIITREMDAGAEYRKAVAIALDSAADVFHREPSSLRKRWKEWEPHCRALLKQQRDERRQLEALARRLAQRN